MDLFLMFYLHRNIINSRVEEEYYTLLANGANHRDVLIENFSETTIKHIVLMEKSKDRAVIITDNKGNIIGSSDISESLSGQIVSLIKNVDVETDELLTSNWKESPYIMSVHPYISNTNQSGYVLMLQSTGSLNKMVHELTEHFGMAGATSFIVLFIVYAVLSKVITRPLIRMKEVS